jgi:Cys-tRNA synthase (O-phospho-L-seryl-tRNA:Cys-tRNA synthase)
LCFEEISKNLDVEKLAEVLNQYQIPIEINCSYMIKGRTDLEKLDKLLLLVEAGVYVNSDGHVLNDLNTRNVGFDYLKEKGFI